jgi:hypothetical protein
MIIDFGLALDGLQPAPPATGLGTATLGPARLLELLELRLGLPPVPARPGEALLAYRACLTELDSADRFYHRSFDVDPIGVARTLLEWRAQWHEAGWDGTFKGKVSQRLGDLAAIEAFARERVPPDAGQRLQRVAHALDEGLDPHIDRIVLHDELAELPAAWRRVLAHFEVAPLHDGAAGSPAIAAEAAPTTLGGPDVPRGTTGDLFAAPATPPRATPTAAKTAPTKSARTTPGSDLARIQRALESGIAAKATPTNGAAPTREKLAGDASFIVVRGISRDLTAQAVAEHLLESPSRVDAVVIAERDGIILDNAFERVGLPRAGFQHYSRFRAVAQVLKLALSQVWEPINPHLLLQFLIHPVGPLPDHARSTLAETVAKEPGVGGTAWRAALAKIDERMQTKFKRSATEAKKLRDDIAYWVECKRFPAHDGAPLGVLIERAQRCSNWLALKLHTVESENEVALYAAAQAQAEALVTTLGSLARQGEEKIERLALERLVDEVGGRAADPSTFAQARHVRATTEPAAITRPWHTVIWWDLAAHVPQLTYPWSDAELAELRAAGVDLPSVDERIRARMRAWLRPILNAKSRLILVIHERDEGHHPLWTRLASLFEGFAEVRIENALLTEAATRSIPALEIPIERLELRPLPRPRRWWDLSSDTPIPPRATESYSSLNKLIYYPHEWVLNYAARVRPGRAADLTVENRLYGNLAHRLFENFFTAHPDWARLEARAIGAWLAARLPELIAQEGALLLEPGMGVERERVTAILGYAFNRLLAHLKSAGIERAAAEQPTEAAFDDVALNGAIDLVLHDRKGREIVLDVKWGGEPYKGDELAENRYLQLATYAYMRKHASGAKAWPYHAYFIVTTGNVLANDATVFPDAAVFAPTTADDIAAIWQRLRRTYVWRRAQIAAGQIEVNAESTEADFRSASPADALATTSQEPDNFDDYTWLTGWDEGA